MSYAMRYPYNVYPHNRPTSYVGAFPPAQQQLDGLGGIFSSLKKIGKVVATPVTLAIKTHTTVARRWDIPGADKADAWVDSVSVRPVNSLVDKITDKISHTTCKALLDQYIGTALTVGLTVVTGGAGLVIMQGGKQIASGHCAKVLAEELAKQGKANPTQTGPTATATSPSSGSFPSGSIAMRQSDGNYRIAVPRGLGDLNAPTHQQVALTATLPAGVTEVSKTAYQQATTPFYARTTFLVGAGVVGAAMILGGIAVKKRRGRR